MPHRFEAAPSGRAGCTNKECKDNKVKILKGELRVGSWIENERFQSYTWRHWGCTTPKVLANIKEEWLELQDDEDGKNYEFLDGWDELPEEYRVKVRTAIEQGHVDDADWKGDAEMNVPGSIGFRVRGKKKADEAKGKNEDTEKEASSPEKPKAKKPRAKKSNADAKESKPTEENGDAEEPAEKPTKKRGPRAKAAADADDAAPAADTETKPKKRGRPAKSADTEEKAAPAKTAAKRKANDDEDKENGEDKPKRRGRPAKSQKTQADDGEAAPEKPKAKRGRKKAEANSDDN